MKKKKINMTYDDMIENIDDIAGIRVVCNFEDDIYKIRNIIKKQQDIKILKEKDYIKKAKKSRIFCLSYDSKSSNRNKK